MEEIIWGIDLGGTKIEGAVLRVRGEAAPEELCRIRVPTEQVLGYTHVLSQVQKLVREMEQIAACLPTRIGIGTPGVLDPTSHLLKNSNTECLRGRPIQTDLAATLGCSVLTANDANCFALAEARFGAAKGQRCVFGVIMGTGVGGGIVLDGMVRYGLQGIAGEFGHISIDPDGPRCYCNKNGCIETFLCGPALEKLYSDATGARATLHTILQNSDTDPNALRVKQQLLRSFGLAISTVINILDPDMVVLGGGVSNIDLLYSEGVQEVSHCVFNDTLHTPIVRNQLGDSAGVYGAACLSSSRQP